MNQILQAALLLALVGTVGCSFSEVAKADDSIKEIVLKLQDEIEEKLSPDLFDKFEALSYRKLQVSGRRLLIKVKATKKDKTKIYLHLQVYDPMWHKNKSLELMDMRTTCSSSDPLESFPERRHS